MVVVVFLLGAGKRILHKHSTNKETDRAAELARLLGTKGISLLVIRGSDSIIFH